MSHQLNVHVQVTNFIHLKLTSIPLLIGDWFDASNLGCYKYLGDKINLTWVEAQQACEQQGGYLAEPYTHQ